MDNISFYQLKQKAEMLERESRKMREMIEMIEMREEMKKQKKLAPTDQTQMALTPESSRWREFVLKRWPTFAEFQNWQKIVCRDDQTRVYYEITGKKTTSIALEALTFNFYPKVEVVGDV